MTKQAEYMVDEIRSEAKYTASMTGREAFSERVMNAIAEVQREKFVPSSSRLAAYANSPLPIGYGQTISQPYIVALMTDLLDLTPESEVLEIGTGSGYQAAVLSLLAKKVYTIEKIPELADSASQRLKKLGYYNVETICSNGYHGWQEKAPFDGIIVTAAAAHIPAELVEQLKPGGRMVIPVGLPYMNQELFLLVKDKNGLTHTQNILEVVFVPLVIEENKIGESFMNSEQLKSKNHEVK